LEGYNPTYEGYCHGDITRGNPPHFSRISPRIECGTPRLEVLSSSNIASLLFRMMQNDPKCLVNGMVYGIGFTSLNRTPGWAKPGGEYPLIDMQQGYQCTSMTLRGQCSPVDVENKKHVVYYRFLLKGFLHVLTNSRFRLRSKTSIYYKHSCRSFKVKH
jgi:hypothetical protein